MVLADTVVFSNNNSLSGTIIQTNGDVVLLLTENVAFNYSKSDLKEIKTEPQSPKSAPNGKLPNFQSAILLLSQEPWATNLTPIPATVIDKGILRNVPYSSFHCGEDYEINIYGELDHPAGIEIGIYRKLIEKPDAKTNCLKFISSILNDASDKDFVSSLSLKGDYKLRDGLTFEITQPTEPDAYGGWWISVYSEQQLNQARASDSEMKQISMAKADAFKQSNNVDSQSDWSANDLKAARPSISKTISFVKKTGEVVTNAEVVRIIDGVSLIYRTGPTSGGMVRLEDLPEGLRNEFGYDSVKTAAADNLAAKQRAQWQQQLLAAQQARQSVSYSGADPLSEDYSGGYSSGGGLVYVHGYYRSNGTYVHSYYRSR